MKVTSKTEEICEAMNKDTKEAMIELLERVISSGVDSLDKCECESLKISKLTYEELSLIAAILKTLQPDN